MGEAPITTRAFIQVGPYSSDHLGPATFEVGQSSSIMDTGPQIAPIVAAPSHTPPPISLSSGLSIRKWLRETDTGFELFYDTEPMFSIDPMTGSLHAGQNVWVMHSSGTVSDSMCPPSSMGSLVCNIFRRRKQARYFAPLALYAPADQWPIREDSVRSMAKRRRRKLRLRLTRLPAAVGSSTGFTSRRRHGQSSHQLSGYLRGCSVSTGVLVQNNLTSELGYDTGVSSPEGHSLYSAIPLVRSSLDSVQVHHQTRRIMVLALDPCFGLTQGVSQEVVPQQPPCSP
ncbi:hypothetical protein CsSME_00040945 [Camellia sinensis var. sinensis]